MPLIGAGSGISDLSFGVEALDGDSRFLDFFRSNAYTLVLLDEYRGAVHVDDSVADADAAGVLLSLAPYQAFKLVPAGSVRGRMVRFHPDFLCVYKHHAELACDGALFDDSYGIPMLRLGEEDAAEFSSLVERMREEVEGGREAADEILLSYLKVLLVKAARLRREEGSLGAAGQADRADSVCLRFRDAVEANFRRLHSVAEYAALLGMSGKSLARRCKALSGKAPLSMILQRVAVEAKRELYLSDRSVKEIAFGLGYGDEFHFSRLFKSLVGVSPARYRETVGSARNVSR